MKDIDCGGKKRFLRQFKNVNEFLARFRTISTFPFISLYISLYMEWFRAITVSFSSIAFLSIAAMLVHKTKENLFTNGLHKNGS